MSFYLPSPDPRHAKPSLVALIADTQAFFLSALSALRRNYRRIFLLFGAAGGVLLILWLLVLNDRAADRRALEARQAALAGEALAPGSPLGCLDSVAGPTLDAACERAVFASATNAAAALAYAETRLVLLADAMVFAREQDPRFAAAVTGLRRSLEQDRFGTLSHVLQHRRGCSAMNCGYFALFSDPGRIRDNMRLGTFEAHLVRAAEAWQEAPGASPSPVPPAPAPPVASIAPTTGEYGADEPRSPNRAPHRPLPPDYRLPSSESIPPVSIMDPEPTTGSADSAGPAETPRPRARPPTVRQPARQPAIQPGPVEDSPPSTGTASTIGPTLLAPRPGP
jgi:hypothetical protein